MSVLDDVGKIGSLIASWIRAGLGTDEILERLGRPGSVGRRLLDAAVARQKAGEVFLGRKPRGEGG